WSQTASCRARSSSPGRFWAGSEGGLPASCPGVTIGRAPEAPCCPSVPAPGGRKRATPLPGVARHREGIRTDDAHDADAFRQPGPIDRDVAAVAILREPGVHVVDTRR